MAWKILQVLALIFGVFYHAYGHGNSDSSDSDEDGEGDRAKKAVVVSVFGVIIIAVITVVVVVVCICKKKKAHLKRTCPSEEAVADAGPLPDKADISFGNTFNTESVFYHSSQLGRFRTYI